MSGRWPGWMFDNLGLKAFALLLAVLLYLHVLTDRTSERVVYFPLEIAGLADSLALSKQPPAEVGVRLRGTGKQLLRLQYTKPKIELSLAGVSPGTFQRAFAPGDVPLAGSEAVTVVEITDPPQLDLEVTPRLERGLPVAPVLVGQPARGFVLSGPPTTRPERVRLSGPAAWVTKQDSLITAPISIAARRDTLEMIQALIPPPAWTHVTPGSVFVQVPIEPEATREVRVNIEVRGIRGEISADVRPEQVLVRWHGPRSAARRLDTQRFGAYVDAGRRGRGVWDLPVTLTGPREGAIVVEPESVRVHLH